MTAIMKYWDESCFQTEQWPCRCTDPAFAIEDSAYVCPHGSWLLVPCAEEARREAAEILSGRCHDLARADALGLLWGDVITAWEEVARKLETPAEKAAREFREKREAEETQRRLVESHVSKFKDIYCGRGGSLKKREMRPCKWFCACSCDRADCPNNGGKARYLPTCHKVVGKACPGGKGWAPGCEAHLKGACPFIHPNEPEWTSVVSGNGSRPSSAGSAASGRDFSGLKSHKGHNHH
jgi:hypothetical protein